VNVDVNKVSAWLAIAVLAISMVITFTQLFGRVDSHEERLGKIEKKTEERDEALRKTLGEIKSSTDYLNWRMDSVVKQLEGKKR
jgi:hypothetical protein